MNNQKLFQVLFILFLFPLVLCTDTGSDLENQNESPVNFMSEMLIKPSVLDFDVQEVDSSLTHTEEKIDDLSATSLSPNFLANLQANAGVAAPIMAQMPAMNDSVNTWIPKFVWIGDIKKSDELKCFAAFLIGSLSNQDASAQQPASPGLFMTPFATPPATAQASATMQQAPQQTLQPDQETAKLATPLIASRSASRMPPSTPVNSRVYTELQAGMGILLFSGVTGNLIPQPPRFFEDIAVTDSANTPIASYPIRGRIISRPTLLFTADIGYRVSDFVQFAVTLQAQQGAHLSTKPIQTAFNRNTVNANERSALTMTHFESDLDLYSVGGKLLLNWNNMFRFNSWGMSLYIGGSAAGGWQNWTQVQAIQVYFNNTDNLANTMTSSNIAFKSRTFGNFAYTGDAGFLFKPINDFAKTSLRVGCKFLGWGSARGLGDIKDQTDIIRTSSAATGNQAIPAGGPIRFSYFKPLVIKTIYSWAPYIGFKWEF